MCVVPMYACILYVYTFVMTYQSSKRKDREANVTSYCRLLDTTYLLFWYNIISILVFFYFLHTVSAMTTVTSYSPLLLLKPLALTHYTSPTNAF